jgi:hypothetical protein
MTIMPKINPTASGLVHHARKWYGKYPGVVAKSDRDEGLGWIEVTLPTVFPKQPPVVARPCFPPGVFWVPPVGAHVWCEFEGGNPNHCLWVGVWYPEGTVPPEADKKPPSSHVLRTPAGHVVELADEDGAERIIVRHKQNAFVAFDEDGSIVLSSKTGATLYLNAEKDEASVMSPQGHSVSLTDKTISLVHKGGATLEILDGKVQVVAKSIDLAGSVNAPGGASLGGGPAGVAFPVALAPALITWLTSHTHGSAMGPTSPPMVPPTPTIASQFVTAK